MELHESSSLDEVADAIIAHSSHRFAASDTDRRRWWNGGMSVQVDCGYCFHYAHLEETQKGKWRWKVKSEKSRCELLQAHSAVPLSQEKE